MATSKNYSGELAAKLSNLRTLGQKEGSKQRPAQDAASPDQHEAELRSDAEGWLASQQQIFDTAIVDVSKSANDARQKCIELNGSVQQLLSDDSTHSAIDADLAGDRPALVKATEKRLIAETGYRYFRAQNDIHHEPHYPESIYWHFGVLAVLGLIETVTNAFFYENSQGLLGGFVVAFGIAALNMGTAMLLGNWFCYQNLAAIDKKVMGWVAFVAFILTTLLFNALFASFRSEYQLVADPSEFKEVGVAFRHAWPEALRIFRADLEFQDLWSFLLFGLGVLLSISAFWKGYTLDDKFPGHGHVDRELKKANQVEHDLHNILRQRVKETLNHRKTAVQAVIQEPSTQSGMISRRISDLTHARDTLEANAASVTRDFELVRDAYRQANVSIRSVPAPAYFTEKTGLSTRVDGVAFERVISVLISIQAELKQHRDEYQGPLNLKLKELQADSTVILNGTFQRFLADVLKEAEESIARITPTIQRVKAA